MRLSKRSKYTRSHVIFYTLLIFNEATVMFSVQYNKTHEHCTCFKKLHGTLSRAEHT